MADITISERQAGDVTILDMEGKVTIGEGSVALRTTIRRLLGEGKTKILLNLGGVGYIDSSGIGELVSSFTAVNKERRHAETSEFDAEDPGPFGDHKAFDRFRRI